MDNQEILRKLETIEAEVQKQNETISRLYRLQKISIYSRYAYWVFLILLAFGAFYFLNPVLSTLGNIYGGSGNVLELLKTVPDLNSLKEFKDQLQ